MRRFGSWTVAGALAGALLGPPGVVAADEKPKPPAAVVTASKDGFVIQSEAGDFKLKITGYAQLDGRFYASDDDKLATSSFTLRRVRPIVQGTLAKIVDFNITPDFGGGTTVLPDAYLELKHSAAARLRFGKSKTPFGLERLQSGAALTLVERAFPTSIAPNRDLGVQLHGEIKGGVASYAVGVFNGVVDGGSADADTNDGKDLAGRVFFQPFEKGESRAWKGLAFGIAGTAGKQDGPLPTYRTSGQLAFFSYATGVVASGTRTRWSPQAFYQNGPFRLFGEYAASRQQVRKGLTTSRVTNSAWEVTTALVLTGESPAAGVVAPKKPFEPGKGGWGAFELAARYHVLDVDAAAFARGLADPAKSAGKAQAWAVGLSWYLNRNVKYFADFERTTFDGGAASGQDRKPENAFLLRAQVAF